MFLERIKSRLNEHVLRYALTSGRFPEHTRIIAKLKAERDYKRLNKVYRAMHELEKKDLTGLIEEYVKKMMVIDTKIKQDDLDTIRSVFRSTIYDMNKRLMTYRMFNMDVASKLEQINSILHKLPEKERTELSNFSTNTAIDMNSRLPNIYEKSAREVLSDFITFTKMGLDVRAQLKKYGLTE